MTCYFPSRITFRICCAVLLFAALLSAQAPQYTPEEAAKAEISLDDHPDDIAQRARLIRYYESPAAGKMPADSVREAIRRHVLWMVEYMPDSDQTRGVMYQFSASKRPELFAELAPLWRAAAEKPDASDGVLRSAAAFFRNADREYAVSLLERALAHSPQDQATQMALGGVYANAILGIVDVSARGFAEQSDHELAESPFAQQARRLLETSDRAAVVGSTAMSLEQQGAYLYRMKRIDFDPVLLAQAGLKRAEKLDPADFRWPRELARVWEQKSYSEASPASKAEARQLALAAYGRALSRTQDPTQLIYLRPAAAKLALAVGQPERAEQYAYQILELAAAQYSRNSYVGDSVFTGHDILGRVALLHGNIELAKAELLASGKTRSTPVLSSFGPDLTLAKNLFSLGERDAVAQFLIECKVFWKSQTADLDNWIAAIQDSDVPTFQVGRNPELAAARIVGKPALDFKVADLQGREYTPSSVKGKVLLLSFWATWCPPCRDEIPHLNKLSEEFGKDGLVILGVDVDEDKDTVDGYAAKHPFAYPLALGRENGLTKTYNVTAYPTVVVIDREGKVVRYDVGNAGEPRLRYALAQAGVGKAPEGYTEHPTAPSTPATGPATWPKVIRNDQPEYSEEARRAKASGQVTMSLVVDENGKTRDIVVVKSLGLGLDEKAVEAVSKWTFQPGTRNGKPVPVHTQVATDFRLLDENKRLRPVRLRILTPNVSRPRLAEGEVPTDAALLPGEQLVIAFDVDEQGHVQNVHRQSGPTGPVHDAAVAAVRQWVFESALRDGKPAPVSGILEVSR